MYYIFCSTATLSRVAATSVSLVKNSGCVSVSIRNRYWISRSAPTILLACYGDTWTINKTKHQKYILNDYIYISH